MLREQSFYTKLVLFSCAICIIPLLALGFFSYMKSSHSIQQHVNQSNVQLMEQTSSNLEQTLQTLDYSLNNFINSTLMLDAMYKPMTTYDFQGYNAIRKELSYQQSSKTMVTDIILVNSTDNWVITNAGLYNLNEYAFKNSLLLYSNLPFISNWLLLPNNSLGAADTESSGCKYMITLIKKMPLHTSEKRGLLFAAIPECRLAAVLGTPSDSHEVMVLDQSNRIIIHPDEAKVGQSVMDSGIIPETDLALMVGKSGQFQSKSNDKDSTITFIRSEFNGWIYVSITDIAVTNKEARAIGWFTLYVLLGIIGLSVFFVWFGSRRMYFPIHGILKGIADRLPNSDKPHKNELLFIDEHLRDLFASNSKLHGELYQTGMQVRSFFLVKLYQGIVGNRELEESLERFGYSKQISSWNNLATLTLQIDLLKETRYEQADLDLLMFAIKNIIEELIPGDNCVSPVIIEQTLTTTIGCSGLTTEAFCNQLYQWTEEIQRMIRNYLELDVSIGISLPFTHIRKAPRAFQEGLEALKRRLTLGEGVIIPYASINAGKHTLIYAYPKLQENELIDSIKLANEDRSFVVLNQWLKEVFQKERSPHEYQISLVRLLNNCMIVMQEAGIRLEQLNLQEGSLYEELLQLYVSSEIETWFKDRIILPMIQVFRDRQESQYQNLSEQIIDIIHKEYERDLTLEECASRMHYNVFYLSSVFKKETNMSFSEYLADYRFQISKKWLVETNLPIKDIAEKLTYTNAQNYIRFFRKLEGMTPGQYRTQFSAQNK